MTRTEFLADLARLHTEWSERVADDVPASIEDQAPSGDTDYPEHHHDVSATPEQEGEYLSAVAALIGRWRASADAEPEGDPVVAAAEVHTGAMVALIPSEDDAARLAVDGGEDPGQLHLTLMYLGAADDIPPPARDAIVARLRALVEDAVKPDYDMPVDADGFAVSVFNPGDANDRDTCIVLGVTGDDLDVIHGMVEDAVGEAVGQAAGFTVPEQHTPWIPHVTLTYSDDLSLVEQLADRVGPVTFDRLRVAFAGENVDIPLGVAEGGEPDDEFDIDWPAYFAEAIQEWFQSRMDPDLQRYWIRRLRLGTKGSFRRCVRALREHFPQNPEGLCANLYHEATGRWPGRKKDHDASAEDIMAVDTTHTGVGDFHRPGDKDHNQKNHGRRKKNMPSGVAGVAADLRAGRSASVAQRDVPELMGILADGSAVNLAHLSVTGEDNQNCYDRHLRDIPRSDMPQLPTNVEELAPFGQRLAEMGVDASLVQQDPRSLAMTQNQLNGAKVGQLYQRIRRSGWQPGGVILASREGAILDGHHRWAAASAAAMTPPPPPLRIPVLRVDLPIDQLLEVAQTMSGPRAGLEAPLAAAGKKKASKFGGKPTSPPPDPDKPWLWFDGQWVLVSMDTTDGVPESLDLPEEPKPSTAAGYDGDEPDGEDPTEVECPEGHHRMPDGECMPDEDMPAGQMTVATDALPGEHFHTRVLEGVSTGMRKFAPGAITWRDVPFAYHWQFKSSAHNGIPETVQVGLVTRAEREGDTVHFWGPLDLRSPEGLDYARRLVEGFARWSSVGADESLKGRHVDVEYVLEPDADGVPVEAGEVDEMTFRAYRVAEVSAVSVPALADATVEPTQELIDTLAGMGVITPALLPDAGQEMAEVAAAAGADVDVVADDVTPFGAVGSHATATAEGDWDKGIHEGRLPSPVPTGTAKKMYAWVDTSRAEDGAVPKDAAKFPHHNVSEDGTPGAANLTACSAIIASLHGSRGTDPNIPDADRRGVYNHARAHLIAGGRDPGDIPPFHTAPETLVAGGYTVTIPDLPPAAWFDEPDSMSPHGELRVEETGRIYGYLAPKLVAHRSFPGQRVQVPMGRVDYSGWQNKPWPVAEGHKIYVGVITAECGHASTNPADRSYDHRREHYDNTCSVVAHARIGENRHGVWVAGALAPWIDAERLGKVMSCQLSGDWAPHADKPGWRDFIAALFVPVEGFAKRVPASVRVADGALVAAAVPVRMVHSEPSTVDMSLQPALEVIARSIGRDAHTRMQALHAEVHRGR